MCNGDYYLPLTIKVLDHGGRGNHQLIGEVVKSVSDLNPQGIKRYDLINRKKAAKKGPKYNNSGYLNVTFAHKKNRDLTNFSGFHTVRNQGRI